MSSTCGDNERGKKHMTKRRHGPMDEYPKGNIATIQMVLFGFVAKANECPEPQLQPRETCQ
ncbi:hypothetical protein TSUD_309040 [Trifolium subterraneum]|nr:hypothetical protein TSUD_309040 [Trifolium subterraneum]